MLQLSSSPIPTPPPHTALGAIRTLSYSSSTSSLSQDSIALPEETVTAEGLKHCDLALNPKKYKKTPFLDTLYDILQKLRVPTWSQPTSSSSSSLLSGSRLTTGPPEKSKVQIFKVSGSLTNAVFFISAPSTSGGSAYAKTLLLRIYGPSSGELISRPAELRILHVLSSQYQIGPRVYGTFANGRVEEYFDSEALSAQDLHSLEVSRWIAIRMAELHRVDVQRVVDPVEWADPVDGTRGELGVKRNIRSWLDSARKIIQLAGQEFAEEIQFERFVVEWEAYYKWVRAWEKEGSREKESERVFCHNDTQYGNLLRLKRRPTGRPPHHQIIVVDFEYASPNPAAFDIANHFHEWTANYHSNQPARLDYKRYPTFEERRNFYQAYLEARATLDMINSGDSTPPAVTTPDSFVPSDSFPYSASTTPASTSGPFLSRRRQSSGSIISIESLHEGRFGPVSEDDYILLEEQVKRWSPASSAMWAVWGIVQAREQVESRNGGRLSGEEDGDAGADFDYLTYAKGRIEAFRREAKALGAFKH